MMRVVLQSLVMPGVLLWSVVISTDLDSGVTVLGNTLGVTVICSDLY